MESYGRANFIPLFSHLKTLAVDAWSSSAHLGNSYCDSLGSGLSGLASGLGVCGRIKTCRETSLLPQTVVFLAYCSLYSQSVVLVLRLLVASGWVPC